MRKALTGLAAIVAAVLVLVIGAGAATTPQTVTATNTTIDGRVDSLVLNGGRLFVGGQMANPFVRLGALNPSTGAVVWSATGVTSEVRALAAINGALYAGGDFGLQVYDLASLNLLATISCGSVRAIEASVDNLSAVVGGNFGTCGGQTHKNLALVTGTTVSSTWAPKTNGTVLALATDAGGTFVGGYFGAMAGTGDPSTTPRYRLGKVTPTGGLDAWNSTYVPNPGDVGSAKSVRALDVAAGRLFASWGESVNKTVIYGQASAAFIHQWVTDGDTQAILTDCGNVYLGGHWYQYAGDNNSSPAIYLAAFDVTSLNKEAVVTPIPYSPLGVFTIISDGSAGLWLGGDVVGNWGTPPTAVKRLVHLTMPASQCGVASGPTTTTTSTTTTTIAGGGSTTTTSTSTTTTTVPPTTTTTTTPGGPDTVEPDSKVTAPAAKATISTPYTFVGTATDNVAVSRVRVAIRNATTLLWLQANGTWGTGFYQVDVTTLVQNGTTWNWTWNGPALPAGSYFFQSKATDTSGNNETSTPWIAFTAA